MTDEECIAIAMLHGAEIYAGFLGKNFWLKGSMDTKTRLHEVEIDAIRKKGGTNWRTRGEVARAYCEFYKLI
jgi:hypothetical protein